MHGLVYRVLNLILVHQKTKQDRADFEAIARQIGPYKLSLHSGSDKLSMYPALARATRGRLRAPAWLWRNLCNIPGIQPVAGRRVLAEYFLRQTGGVRRLA